MSDKRRAGFTLIEVLIVVVIMSILAATIIPQFANSTTDAKESAVRYNLRVVRGQIEKQHHSGSLPNGTSNLAQLTSATNGAGVVGSAGAAFPYGPYARAIPVNPFTNSAKVTVITGAPAATGASDAGWLYRAATGEFWIDQPAYVTW